MPAQRKSNHNIFINHYVTPYKFKRWHWHWFQIMLNRNTLSQLRMIGFVTCPPFLHHHYYKGGQVTKPIIVVKTCYKLL